MCTKTFKKGRINRDELNKLSEILKCSHNFPLAPTEAYFVTNDHVKNYIHTMLCNYVLASEIYVYKCILGFKTIESSFSERASKQKTDY